MKSQYYVVGDNPKYYVLDDNHEIVVTTADEWAEFFESTARIVKQEDIGDTFLSTVFLGMDHNFTNEGPPILFETMAFFKDGNDIQERCATWDEALAQHERIKNEVQSRSTSR